MGHVYLWSRKNTRRETVKTVIRNYRARPTQVKFGVNETASPGTHSPNKRLHAQRPPARWRTKSRCAGVIRQLPAGETAWLWILAHKQESPHMPMCGL